MERRELVQVWLRGLRERIIAAFAELEGGAAFQRTPWDYRQGSGGGEMALLRGSVFEKAAVNFSAVGGAAFPLDGAAGPFFATGVSLITHMYNPKMPTVHMNLRYIEAGDRHWLGGGYDLTPMGFANDEDTRHFHQVARDSLAPHGPALYETFAQNARDYFFIPHWNSERGVGGLFFDHYNSGDWQRDLALWQAVGDGFLDAIMPIYRRRLSECYTPQDKETQQWQRARYVEFNLLYDRGTRFGFNSGGNPEAILCSMPPQARW